MLDPFTGEVLALAETLLFWFGLGVVLATQNPIESEGTYNLPEDAQLGRVTLRALGPIGVSALIRALGTACLGAFLPLAAATMPPVGS